MQEARFSGPGFLFQVQRVARTGVAPSENRAHISTMAADKRPTGTHNPNQNSLQRWANEGGAEKGVHQKSPGAARAKKKQPAKAAKRK
jgi:hypothetical protein